MKITLTEKERNVLMYVKGEQAKPRHSHFTSQTWGSIQLGNFYTHYTFYYLII